MEVCVEAIIAVKDHGGYRYFRKNDIVSIATKGGKRVMGRITGFGQATSKITLDCSGKFDSKCESIDHAEIFSITHLPFGVTPTEKYEMMAEVFNDGTIHLAFPEQGGKDACKRYIGTVPMMVLKEIMGGRYDAVTPIVEE